MGRESETAVKRIAITGSESTGKSWLAKKLGEHFGEPWVPEYARLFLNATDNRYDFLDILTIAQGQFLLEEKIAKEAKNYLFADTDFLVTRIWCMFKYGKSHPWIDYMVNTHLYDHYLLCNTDLPWEPDVMREHPEQRNELLHLYQAELTLRKLPFSIISGHGQDRLESAINIINKIE